MHIVLKEGIQILLRKPEKEEPLGMLERTMKCQSLKEVVCEDRIIFVRLMIRLSGGLFCM